MKQTGTTSEGWTYIVIAAVMSVLLWLVLAGILLFLPHAETQKIHKNSEMLLCAVVGVENDTVVPHGWPVVAFETADNVCVGTSYPIYPIGIAVDVLAALAVAGGLFMLLARYLRKKYAIIAST